MSFALTTPQMLARTKTVTRRLGWRDLQPGTLLQAVEKSQGLKKGEKVRKLGVIRVVSVTREPLSCMDEGRPLECAREGFPDMRPAAFCRMFCAHNGGDLTQDVTRIEFEHVPETAPTENPCAGTRRIARGETTLAKGSRRAAESGIA